jgi:hypothetical protein
MGSIGHTDAFAFYHAIGVAASDVDIQIQPLKNIVVAFRAVQPEQVAWKRTDGEVDEFIVRGTNDERRHFKGRIGAKDSDLRPLGIGVAAEPGLTAAVDYSAAVRETRAVE